MTDLRSRVHLFDEKLTLLPEFMPHFDTWAMMSPSGQVAKSKLAELGIDSWMQPACATFAQSIGPEPGSRSMEEVTAALQHSFGDVKPGLWDSLYAGARSGGKMFWPKLQTRGSDGKPIDLGRIAPDGTPEFKPVTGLIDGFELGASSVHIRIYKNGGTSVDILPRISIGISPDNAPAFRGAGVGIKLDKRLNIDANIGRGQTGAVQGGVQLHFYWDWPWLPVPK